MPRRAVTRTSAVPSLPASSPPPPLLEDVAYHSNLFTLRRCWKWAAFSQFFFTFAPLFAMNDVSISDIEEDLARSTRLHLPRIIQRLLYVLTQDRKISLDNWQSALRKQYARRNPAANPIGFEPKKINLRYSIELVQVKDEPIAVSLHTPGTSVPPEGSVQPQQPQIVGLPRLPAQSDDGETPQTGHHRPSSSDGPKSDHGHDFTQGEEREQDELKDWLELPMLTKLDSLYLLTEWQFHNPNRIRTIMKDDDETAQWRIEPIGYDAKSNAYWFIGADRLWLQRLPHKPKTLKRKRAPAATLANIRKTKRTPVEANGRGRKAASKRRIVEDEDNSETESLADEREVVIAANGTGTRAAKTEANKKLDAQAKALAEFQRQKSTTTRGSGLAKRHKLDEDAEYSTPRRTLGTRLSKRLRGTVDEEDEWQQIPDEWLGGDGKSPQAIKQGAAENLEKIPEVDEENDISEPVQASKTLMVKTGLESDTECISDLTDLSTDSDEEGCENDDEVEKEDQPEKIEEQAKEWEPSPEVGELVEWEMICSTMEEWEHIAERFEKATHYAEKALYKLLSHHIVPAVIQDLQEIERVKQEEERKKHVEEAVVHRKRSSRIAIKESEKEEARMAAQRKTDEVEKMSRAKRLEMRLKREEAEKEKKEQAKEQRRLEREQKPKTAPSVDGSADASRETSSSSTRIANGSQIGGNWELDCEVCHKCGINQDDGVPLICCGSCNKWQHIQCHNTADLSSGRHPRNWEAEEFLCSNCRLRATTSVLHHRSDQYQHPHHNYAQAKIQLRWDHGRSSPKLPQMAHRVEPSVDPRSNRMRPYVPNPVNGDGSSPQPVHNGQYPPETPNPYSNITFSHYQPQHRGFSSSSRQGLQCQPQLPPPQQSLSQSSYNPPNSPAMYPPYNTTLVNPQAYGSQSGFNEGYQLPTVPSSLQNGVTGSSWDTPRGYANAPAMNYPHTAGYGTTQDPRLYHHQRQQQRQPVTTASPQWGYGPPPSQSPHLNMNGAGAPLDYGM